MAEERLQDLLSRLERERDEASERYNRALTGVDRALQRAPEIPSAPPAYDERQIAAINKAWDILPAGAPTVDGSLKGRLRGFIWRLVGPSLEQQKGFNAALVDHLNRNLAAHREAANAVSTLVAMSREQAEGQINFQQHLIQYLQTITLYVDTKDRATGSQAQVLNAALSALTDDWLKRWESLAAREQRFQARVESLDNLRASVAMARQMSFTLKREVERLLAAPRLDASAPPGLDASTPDLDSFKYVGFEDAFRGSLTEIRARLTEYAPLFDGQSEVLDIGCGRGEFLDVLRERGISARGLDLNHEMVEVSRARGLDVTEGEALGYLRSLADESLGGVFAAQVAEHLEPSYLMRVIETAYLKMRPGGVMVLETINPACWVAFFESYIRDLTHVRPLHPDTLKYLLQISGFQHVEIAYKSPIAEWARLQPAGQPPPDARPALVDLFQAFNENVAKLNARMFTYQDYAAVARK